MRPNGGDSQRSGVALIFREGHHVLVPLDANGDLIPVQERSPGGGLVDLAISCDRIHTGDPVIDKAMANMLKACQLFDERSPGLLPRAVSTRTSDGRSILVDVFLVPHELGETLQGARFMLTLRQVRDRRASRKRQMRQRFRLTATEADLVELLLLGKSLKEAAEHLCISIWTARSHLRSIFQKTGTHRQGALIALLNDKTS